MKLQKTILLGTVLLLLAFALATQADAELCVPSFIDTQEVSGTYSSVLTPQDGTCPPAHVKTDGSLSDQEALNESQTTTCCCRCFGNDNYEVISFEAPTGYEHLVSKVYCEEKGYEPGTIDNQNCTDACSNTCSGTGGPLIEETDLYHEIQGYVRINATPAGNVSVFALDQGDDVIVEATTDSSGYYNLGAVPGVKNGENTFLALTPETHEYDCADNYQQYSLSGDKQINFTMEQCTINDDYCVADWNVSDWGECKPYFGQGFQGQYVQTRTVTDKNNCNMTDNKPQTWKLCEGNVTLSNCGNGEIEQGEFCDPATQEGSEVFTLPDGETSSSATCKDVLGEGYSDETKISCTDSCTYDYSDCQPVCGMHCDRVEECEMEECQSLCQGEPLCGNECEGQQPVFLPTNSSGLDIFSTRNVYDLYESGVLEPSHFPGIKYVDQSKDVKLTWSFNGTCEDEILAYQVVYCEEDGDTRTCDGDTRQRVEVTRGNHDHTVKNLLKPDTSFCYNVCAITTDGEMNCAYDETDKLPCFHSGEQYCMEPHPDGYDCKETSAGEVRPTGCSFQEFDGAGSGTYRMTNHSYDVSDEDCTGKTCVETPYDPQNNDYGATCKAPLNCSTCNGPFGLFSSGDNKVSYFKGDRGTEMKCSRFDNPSQSQFANTEWAGLCYYDTSLSSHSYYDTCSKVKTCYDYMSEEACSNDPCNSMNSECEWSSNSKELGVGVCRPKETEQQDCTRCDTDSPLGFCTESLCEDNYGDCYFREPSKNTVDSDEKTVLSILQGITTSDDRYTDDEMVPTCINKDSVACSLYQDKDDCIGSGGNVSVDVTYDNATALYGTNEKLSSSQDRYGFGDCAWTESANDNDFNGCHKNSDGLYDQVDGNPSDDCYTTSYYDDLKCLQDTTPPNTTLILREPPENEIYQDLPTYGINEIANITFKVEDETWAADQPDTYFSILSQEQCPAQCYTFDCQQPNDPNCISQAKQCKDKGCAVYPDAEQVDMATEEYKNETVANGVHKLLYFSQDPARNLENVKSTELFIDSIAPDILHTSEDLNITSFKMNDIYRSNVSLSFETSEEATCTYYLEYQSLDGKKIYGQEHKQVATTFSKQYYFVPDNYYEFVITCKDKYKNTNTKRLPVRVEGDVSISNATPRLDVYNKDELDDIELSINTIDEANCRFDPERDTFDSARHDFISSANGMTHTRMFSDIVDTNTSQSLEGIYSYYTACDYTNRTITEGLHSDMISFSIDTTGPETTLYYFKDNEYIPFKESGDNATPRSSERMIRIECDDGGLSVPGTTFGCKEIRYCYSEKSILDLNTFDPATVCLDGKLKSTNPKQHFEDTLHFTTDSDMKIYYYGVDNGGNKGEIHRMNLKVTDTDFERPTFKIV